jgi:hypothetical protein
MSEIKMDRELKAYLESGTTLRFSNDAEVVDSNPWGAPIAKAAVDDGAGEIPEVVGAMFAKAEKGLLAKSIGLQNESWDATLTSPLSETFIKNSDARLQKMRVAIERVFVGHPQECQEAISIARQALSDARDEALAMA